MKMMNCISTSLIKALITSKRGKMMKEIKDIYNMTKEENIFCAKRVLVDSIYKQANLEGIGVTFAETQDILNNVNVDKVTPTDMSKVCCLRDGWHYLFDHLDEPVDLVFLESIHELTARFDVPYQYLGKLRVDDVMISGTDWRPEIPDVETNIPGSAGTKQDRVHYGQSFVYRSLHYAVHRCLRTEIRESGFVCSQ